MRWGLSPEVKCMQFTDSRPSIKEPLSPSLLLLPPHNSGGMILWAGISIGDNKLYFIQIDTESLRFSMCGSCRKLYIYINDIACPHRVNIINTWRTNRWIGMTSLKLKSSQTWLGRRVTAAGLIAEHPIGLWKKWVKFLKDYLIIWVTPYQPNGMAMLAVR